MTKRPASPSFVTVQMLRALAALSVTVAHYHHEYIQVPGGVEFGFGAFGVDLFFVISGFIMTYTCWPHFGRPGAAANFFLRRLARIAPLYWVASAIYLGLVLYTQTLAQADLSWPSIAASFLFVPYPRPSGFPQPMLGVGWTLNYEMFFYAVFAVALLFRRTTAIIFALLFLAGISAFAHWFVPATAYPWSYWSAPLVLEFAIGMVVALVYNAGIRITRRRAGAFFVIGLAVPVFVYCTTTVGHTLNPYASWVHVFGWGPAAGLILAGAVLAPWEAGAGRAARWLSTVGDSSYALYLIHPLFIWIPFLFGMHHKYPILFGWHQIALPVKNWPYVVLLLALTLAASVMVYRKFERPLTRWLYKIIERRYPIKPTTDAD